MVKVVVCIGSACHLKGSRKIVEDLQYFIKRDALDDKIELSGTFCMDKCNGEGVSVTIDGEYFSIKSDEIENFFERKIKSKV